MANVVRWFLAGFVVLVAVVPPFLAFRYQYAHAKRFREVSPGRFYRSGQMTAAGFREAIDRHGIKTVINLQHEDPDPFLPDHLFGQGKLRESELCQQLGVRYVLLTPDILPANNRLDLTPPAVEEFVKLLDNPEVYPVLLHCKAGLHRTGRLTAIYRMEYEGWTHGEAMRELRAAGYGFVNSSEADNYIIQFVQNYTPRSQRTKPTARAPMPRPATPATSVSEGGGR
jgi:protein tyrosine/serine phosphatase